VCVFLWGGHLLLAKKKATRPAPTSWAAHAAGSKAVVRTGVAVSQKLAGTA
jgi:hypothetical protein